MVDIAAFQEINKQMQEYDEKREKVIKDSRGAPFVGRALPVLPKC